MEGEMTEVYLTKYWWAGGITKRRAQLGKNDDDLIKVVDGRYSVYYVKPDWHRTEAEAIDRVKVLLTKKIASTEKALKKLKAFDIHSRISDKTQP